MGMDLDGVCALTGVRGLFVLSGLFGQFFRRQAFRDEGRIAADRCVYVAPILPELVPAALPACVRYIPLRGGIAHGVSSANGTRKSLDSYSVRILLGRGGWTEPTGTEGTPFEISVR